MYVFIEKRLCTTRNLFGVVDIFINIIDYMILMLLLILLRCKFVCWCESPKPEERKLLAVVLNIKG